MLCYAAGMFWGFGGPLGRLDEEAWVKDKKEEGRGEEREVC
jgi:hypothetical protein